jgi:hypothetical protein
MSLQNRVTPTGEIIACRERGTMMGNRGGALHAADRTLGQRRWISTQWICCLIDFRGRRRQVMAPGHYTELFFLDEATALASGHRPCFECRRQDAVRFAELWAASNGRTGRARASEMDRELHAQRLGENGAKRIHPWPAPDLPEGTFVLSPASGAPALVTATSLLPWSPAGYAPALARPRSGTLRVLTPPAIVGVLAAGYRPVLHVSARPRT